MKWVLFWLMTVTVPVLYSMFVVGGFLPLIAIAAMSVRGVWGFVLFNAVHLLIYGAAFYWVARAISSGLAALSPTWKHVGFAGMSTGLVAIGFFPIYGVGHHAFQAVNLYHLLRGLFTTGL